MVIKKRRGTLQRRVADCCGGLYGRWGALCGSVLLAVCGLAQAAPVGPALERPAVMVVGAERGVMQGADRADHRMVAVGERGIVVVSDDGGGTWRQASVPVGVGLTAVRFVDARRGWVVGHGGIVLATVDGGATWTKQLDGLRGARLVADAAKATGDPNAIADAERLVVDGADKPLLDLCFFDDRRGIVVGAYNLAFETTDGGHTWQALSGRLDNPRGLHLYAVRARGDEIVIVGEQGLVLRSIDAGRSFRRLTLPYKGSFFSVALPPGDEIIVAGLRGNVLKSVDGGASWSVLRTPVPVTITAVALDSHGQPWFANQAGMVLKRDGDALVPLPVKLPPLNGLLPLSEGQALGLTLGGVVPVTLGVTK